VAGEHARLHSWGLSPCGNRHGATTTSRWRRLYVVGCGRYSSRSMLRCTGGGGGRPTVQRSVSRVLSPKKGVDGNDSRASFAKVSVLVPPWSRCALRRARRPHYGRDASRCRVRRSFRVSPTRPWDAGRAGGGGWKGMRGLALQSQANYERVQALWLVARGSASCLRGADRANAAAP